ncbi:hypothetical protein DENSPDRAFT_902536 [Dentipellis sp. KUC8613]|nr:hypothetical protein DENSPDRAFT_902536 [Dentipellis sp. KUC8613]
MLLQWCTLEPTGPSSLAAIRFSSPVRVRSIRLFPKHAQPFAQHPDITSETEPDAFFVDIFFNAQPISIGDAKQKQKATNALVPTTIAYAGGYVEYDVDMGNEFATRLMIVRGDFVKLSLAIYGDVASELPPPPTTYTPSVLETVEPTSLSPVLDPSNSTDPTALARQLLSLIPDAPPLALIIRLMFCLKPSDEEWDLPDFPYLPADLDEDTMDFDLDAAFRVTNRPVPDDTPVETLQRFADRVADAVGPKTADQAFLVAGILSHAACQHPEMARLLLDRLDFQKIFDPSVLDEDTLAHLLIAAANPDVARHILASPFAGDLQALQTSALTSPAIKTAAQRLTAVICGWDVLADALWNTQADFRAAGAFLRTAGTEEPTFGTALHALVTHADIVAGLAENLVVPRSMEHPPLLLDGDCVASHDEFIAFLRAWIGVACVLAVYAWADSLPNGECRERALGVLRVWQETKGYREILNQLLLLRQMIYRLECMIEDDAPSRSGIHAENILRALCRSPAAFLSPHLKKCLFSRQPGLCAISDSELADLHALAQLADGGLAAALTELTHPLTQPLTPPALAALRIALALVGRELAQGEEGELHALSTLWEQHSHGLAPHLVAVLAVLAAELRACFPLAPPARADTDAAPLFLAADAALRIVRRLAPAYPLAGRSLRALVRAAADVFACSDAADLIFAQGSPAWDAAQRARQTCIELVRTLSNTAGTGTGTGKGAEVVLRALLQHGAAPGAAGGRDPAAHVLQVFSLVDHLLPMPRDAVDMETADAGVWVRAVVPRVLPDLAAFCRRLDIESRAHLVRRLADLDEGAVGVGEWLVLEELKMLNRALKGLAEPDAEEDFMLFKRYEVGSELRMVCELVSGDSATAIRLLGYLASSSDAAGLLTSAMQAILSLRLSSPYQVGIAERLVATNLDNIDHTLLFTLALTFLRSIRPHIDAPTATLSVLEHALTALRSTPLKSIDPDRLSTEIGGACVLLAEYGVHTSLSPDEADATVALLEWLVQQSHAGLPQLSTLRGLSHDTLARLCDVLGGSLLDPDRADALEFLRVSLSGSADDASVPAPTVLPERLTLSLHRVDAVLRSGMGPPATPKRTTPPQAQGMLGLVTVSPPTALLRSPAVTGLTKTYTANDFRQLRQMPSARQNTSRLPSTHVDQFESAMSSPTMMTGPLPSVPGVPPTSFDGFTGLAPPFPQ